MKTASNIVKNKQPLGTTAYQEIYRKIITLEYEPGQRFEEHLTGTL
jgi:DNA-binding GntR family transcriptional regulator